MANLPPVMQQDCADPTMPFLRIITASVADNMEERTWVATLFRLMSKMQNGASDDVHQLCHFRVITAPDGGLIGLADGYGAPAETLTSGGRVPRKVRVRSDDERGT